MGPSSILPSHRPVSACLLMMVLSLVTVVHTQTLATTVPLVLPSAIAFDSQGNLYIAETASHVVRKVDVAGHITTVAGTGTQGFDGDGESATAALLDSPQGLAVDAKSLYIADSHNHRVRKVDLASGTIKTVAGSSVAGAGGDGGQAADATLDLPTALALDSSGVLYIADTRSHRVRRIASDGVITTVVGTGVQGFDGEGASASTALLDSPGGIAVDSAGNLYIADSHNHRVRKVDVSTGTISTLAGSGVQGYAGDTKSASAAKLALPRNISFDQQGNVYIADTANHRIRRVDGVTGTIATIVGDGVQAYSGDGGSPTSASLDSPRSANHSPLGSLTIADTGNARIRQVVSGTSLQTIAGLGVITPGVLTLTGPSVISYGAGSLTATLSTSSATGGITFLDSYLGGSSTIASVALVSNTAVLDLSTLPAGQHSVKATYAGDQAHGSAQSTFFALTVSPIALTAAITPTSIIYGQPVPALAGTLAGILPRDQANVSATYSTSAGTLSPAGSYPITVALTGAGAGNYTLAAAPSLVITKAPTVTTLAATAAQLVNGTTVGAGQTVTFTAHIASTTSGIPTGTITILDGSSALSVGKANSLGDLIFTTSTLGVGAHSLTAIYSGDGNFNASSSSPTLITVDAPQTGTNDFTLASTGASTQTIIAGNSASFTFSVQPQGGLSSQVSLAASGLPNLATASFNPAYVPPGSSATVVTLSIVTPKTARLERHSSPVIVAFLLSPFAAGILLRSRGGRISSMLAVILLATPVLVLTGCGDRIYTGNSATQSSKTYTITVTGTATSAAGAAIQHGATVTLVVAPAN